MFSVGRDSLSGVVVLAMVVNGGQDGVSAQTVSSRLDELSCVSLRENEVGDVLRALERQEFVVRDGIRFRATESGCERVRKVMREIGIVTDAGVESGDESASRELLVSGQS